MIPPLMLHPLVPPPKHACHTRVPAPGCDTFVPPSSEWEVLLQMAVEVRSTSELPVAGRMEADEAWLLLVVMLLLLLTVWSL
jgi:hypothetical protein